MSLKHLHSRDLRLVSLYSSQHAVRGGTGLVFLLLVLLTGLMIAHFVITPVEQGREAGVGEDEAGAVDWFVRQARPTVEWMLGTSDDDRAGQREAREWASYLLDERPALLSAVLIVLVFSLPFLVGTGAFNQFSGDVQSRGIRYQLLRTERANLFFGRFLGTAVYTALVLLVLLAVIVLYMGLKLEVYGWGELLLWGFLGFVAAAVVSLPYVALCSWVSAMVDSPLGSLVVAHAIIGFVPLIAAIGRKTWEPVAHVTHALPWGVQNHLLHPDPLTVLGAVAACVGYTALFLTFGYLVFARRDL